MDQNTLIVAAAIGVVIMTALPGLINALLMRSINRSDKETDQREHEKEQARARELEMLRQEIANERMAREAMKDKQHELELRQGEFLKREELNGLYDRLEEIRKEFREDLRTFVETWRKGAGGGN